MNACEILKCPAWDGKCNQDGDTCRYTRQDEIDAYKTMIDRLTTALHDAIARPMGVVPDSALEFYSETRMAKALAERPRMYDGVEKQRVAEILKGEI